MVFIHKSKPGLPAMIIQGRRMSLFSFIHTADLHLDSPFSLMEGSAPELAGILRSATFEAYEKVIQACIEHSVDFLLVAGDVYDGADRSLRAQIAFRNGLNKLDEAGVQSFVVHGNHDPLNGWSSKLDRAPGTHIFGDRLESIPFKKKSDVLATIQGISYPDRNEKRNLARFYRKNGPAFHIGLLHANVGPHTGHQPYAPCTMEDLTATGVDYWALGHVHQRAILSADRPVIVYPGTPQGRNIKEVGEKGCTLVHVHRDGIVELEFIPTDVIQWVKKDLSIGNFQTEQDLIQAIDEICAGISKSVIGRPVVLRLCLKGGGPLFHFLMHPGRVADLLETAREFGMCYSPFIWIERLLIDVRPELDPTVIRDKGNFLGELLRIKGDLLEGEGMDAFAKEATSTLFEDSRAGRFCEFPRKERLLRLLENAEEICIDGLLEDDRS
jgi:DNA repair exonuclease SbcCD nuclease subunit